MKEEELIKKIKQVKLPDIEMESHRSRLKMALLNSDPLMKKRRGHFMDAISHALTVRYQVWKVSLVSVVSVLALVAAFFSIPATSAVLQSTFFPEGRRVISGPQLTAEEQQKARDILMADTRITDLLTRGAAIDKILPIQVTYEKLNPQSGNTEQINETWAQAWLVKGSQDWGVQIDLVRGQIESITGPAN